MATGQRVAKLGIAILACVAISGFASEKREFRYPLGPGGSISILNNFGPVSLKPSAGNEVVVTATAASKKVEVDCGKSGNRIDVHTHYLQPAGRDDGRVDYVVEVPPDSTITVRAGSGPIRVENLRGDITLEGESSDIDVRGMNAGQLRAHTVSGPITVSDVNNVHVELISVGGHVKLSNVTGPKVSVNTTKGSVDYAGNFSGGGEYSFTNHSGDINVSMPADASVDVTARTVSGSVVNDFPFKPSQHPTFKVTQGHSFAGTSNSGASMVRLRSFTGTITVRKQ